MIEERKHSKIGASSAERWMNCPQSPRMGSGRKRTPTEWSAEGTVAHHVAEASLKKGVSPEFFLFDVIEQDGFEVQVHEEMLAAVQVYIDTIQADMAEMDTPVLRIEQGFHLEHIHHELYGTNDACLFESMFGDVLRVYDYKHGAGKAVEVADNPQLKIYALGALYECPDVAEVELVIVQPRAFHKDGPVRRWRVTVDELKMWAHGPLTEAILATEDPKAPFNPNNDWCGWCPGIDACPALRKHAVEAFDVEFDEASIPAIPVKGLPAVDDLTPEQMAKMLEFKPLAEKLLTEVYNKAKAMLALDPDAIPGFKLVEGRANRSWVENFEEVNGPLFMVLKQEMYDVKFKSPAKMEAALKAAGANPRKVDTFVKVSRGTQVAPVYDKRPAYVPADKMFPEDENFIDL
jgi:hypothetical protein